MDITVIPNKKRFRPLVLTRLIVFLTLFVPLLLLYSNTMFDRAYFWISLTTDRDSEMQIYWAGENQDFSEERSVSFPITPEQHLYRLYVTDLKGVKRLRIDPLKKQGSFTLHYIKIHQEEFKFIKLKTIDELKQLKPSGHIKRIEYTNDGLRIESVGIDPRLSLELNLTQLFSGLDTEVIRLFFLIAILWTLTCLLTSSARNMLNYTGVFLWIVAGLVLTMAALSKYNQHPDEHVHLKAAAYYENHWLPPKICAPETEHTYSSYGVSRLDTKEITYFLAGKIAFILHFAPIHYLIRIRLFNFILLFILLLLWHKNKEDGILFIPLLISPQVWYVFSYFSSDAFSLSLGFFISYQIINKKSFFRSTFLVEEMNPGLILKTIVCGLIIGSVFFLKVNYYFLIMFWVGYLLLEFIFNTRSPVRIQWVNVSCVVAAAIFFIVSIHSVHFYVNGFDRKIKLLDCQEKLARYECKPSTPFDKQKGSLNIKAKGLPLSFVIEYAHWPSKIFCSSFGLYGYTNIIADPIYYTTIGVAAILLLAYIVLSILMFASVEGKILLLFTLLCSGMTIFAALLHSWFVDIQAQGRYLFPILPMFGMLLYKTKDAVNTTLLYLITFTLFMLSIYSFVFVALKYIPKV